MHIFWDNMLILLMQAKEIVIDGYAHEKERIIVLPHMVNFGETSVLKQQ